MRFPFFVVAMTTSILTPILAVGNQSIWNQSIWNQSSWNQSSWNPSAEKPPRHIRVLYFTRRDPIAADPNPETAYLARRASPWAQKDPLPDSPIKNKIMDESLEWFIVQLKTFIQESHFDTFRFGVMVGKLTQDLHDIVALGGPQIDWNNLVLQKYDHANYMFKAMVDALHALEFYQPVSIPENYLLSRMIDANVRILALLDSQGFIDTEVNGYARKVSELNNLFAYWKHSFLDLTGADDVNVYTVMIETRFRERKGLYSE
ncbi:hypothetical protein JCM33374_g4223 [Metschnikowia sp. JCM 33374]|nr:hypothetical protein JCM33374_g4223 [Metschnikowia sp. JCM 33374]